jgi:hypothetical protein
MNIQLLALLANAFSTLAANPAFGKNGQQASAIVGLLGTAFTAGAMVDAERKKLLLQIEDANNSGRGSLTDAETEEWKTRHATAAAAIQAWKP